MTLKAKAVIDGKTVEVDLAEPPAGFIAEDQLDVRFEKELGRRAESLKKKALETALDDDDFFAKAVEKRGLKLDALKGGSSDGKLDADKVNGLRSQWEKEVLSPIQQKLDAQLSLTERLKVDKLHGEILAVAGPLLKDTMLTAPVEGGVPPIVAILAPQMGWAEDVGMWAVRKGDSFDYNSKATKERPYKGAREIVEEWVKNPANADFVRTRSQGGPGVTTGKDAVKNGVLTISREEARDVATYRRARERADKEGLKLQIAEG